MKEVEVKAKISNPQELISRLQNLGCQMTEPITQNDQIYLPAGFKLSDNLNGINVLRIRQANDQIIFTLKQPQLNELDCVEKELNIKDPQAMEEMLELLGYKETVRVNKTRIKCQYRDYKICIDKVDTLGDFIEVEKMTDQDSLATQEELFNFLKTLGIGLEDRVEQGYDTLVYNKLNK